MVIMRVSVTYHPRESSVIKLKKIGTGKNYLGLIANQRNPDNTQNNTN